MLGYHSAGVARRAALAAEAASADSSLFDLFARKATVSYDAMSVQEEEKG